MKMTTDSLLVWQVTLDDHRIHQDYFHALLSTDEQARADHFCFQEDRAHFIIARGILKYLIGQLLNQAPDRLQFLYNVNGKPYLQADNALRFNLSHNKGQAIYAFARYIPVGIDIEYRNPHRNIEGIVRRFFTAAEYHSLQNLTDQAKIQAFFSVWSQKEAILKALGLSLLNSLPRIEVAVSPAPMDLISIYGHPVKYRQWLLQSVSDHADFEAVVAAPMPHLRLEVQRLHAMQIKT